MKKSLNSLLSSQPAQGKNILLMKKSLKILICYLRWNWLLNTAQLFDCVVPILPVVGHNTHHHLNLLVDLLLEGAEVRSRGIIVKTAQGGICNLHAHWTAYSLQGLTHILGSLLVPLGVHKDPVCHVDSGDELFSTCFCGKIVDV